MALTKISTAMISQSAAAVDLNVDAGTFYVDTTNNRVGVGGKTDPDTPLHVVGTATATLFAGSGASLTSIPNSALVNSSITINSTAVSLGGSITLGTDDLSEGSSNLYYTDARVDARVSGGSLGNITTTGYIRGPATFTLDPAAHGDDTGTVVIAGNLQVDGTTTTINSTTMTVDDKNITLASGSANAAAADGAGFTVDIGTGTLPAITYDGTNDTWDFNKPTHVEVAGSRVAEFGRTGAGTFDLTISDIGVGAAQLWFQAQTNDTGFNFRPKSSSGTNTNALYIAPDGKVGIGTTSPAVPLHVTGNISSGAITSVIDSTNGLKITANSGGAGATITAFQGSTNSNIRTLDIDAQTFVVNTGAPQGTTSTQALLIDSSQNATFAGTISSGAITSSGNVQAPTLSVNHTGALSGTQVYIKKDDANNNLMRWGEGTSGQDTYRFRIDQSFKFIGNSGSGDNIILDSANGNIRGTSFNVGSTAVIDSSRNLTNIGTISSGAITSTGDVSADDGRVRIGNPTTLSGRSSIRIDANGDSFADLVFGDNTSSTGWWDANWSISSRSSSENNSLKIYRGSGQPSPYNSEHVLMEFKQNNLVSVNSTLQINNTTVIDSSRNLTNIGTISSADDITTLGNIKLNRADGFVYLNNQGTGNAGIYVRGITSSSTLRSHSTNNFRWEVTGSQKMELDSSGILNAVGGYKVNGTLVIDNNKRLLVSDGSAAAPYMTFAADTNTGFYRPSPDNIGFAIGGVARAFMSANQFNMTGNIALSGALLVGGTTVIDASRNLTNIGTISSGAITATSNYSGGSGDYTAITNAPLKIATTSSYFRIPHISASSTISGIYNYETGKNVYWGEPDDTGTYYFRGRNVSLESSNLQMGGTTVIDASRNLTNIGTISSGAITSSSTIRANDWYRGGSDTNALYSDTSQGTIIQTPSNTNNAAGSFYIRDSQGNVHFTLNTNTNAASFHGGTISSGAITSTGYVTASNAKMGVWNANGAYSGIFQTSHASASYGIIFDATNTFVGSGTGGSTTIRYDNNESANQLKVNSSGWSMGSTVVMDGSRNLTNIGTISSGEISATNYKVGTTQIVTAGRSIQNIVNYSGTGEIQISGNLQSTHVYNSGSYYVLNQAGNAWNTVVNRGNGDNFTVNTLSGFTVGGTTVIDASKNATVTTLKETDGGYGFIEMGPSSASVGYFNWGIEIAHSGSGYTGLRFAGKKKYFELEADIFSGNANHQGFFWGNVDGTAVYAGSSSGYKTTHQNSTNFHIRDINGNANQVTINPGFSPSDSVWHHHKVAATPDGYVRVWLDGVLVMEQSGYIPSAAGYLGLLNYTGTARFANIVCRNIEYQRLPSFRVDQTYVQSIGTGNYTVAFTDTPSGAFDIGNNFSGNVFTAPVAGTYQFSTSCRVDGASGYYRIIISKNNSIDANTNLHSIYGAPTGTYESLQVSGALYLASGDTARVIIYANSDTSWISQGEGHFSGHLIG